MAIGRLGLSLDDFFRLTLNEFFQALDERNNTLNMGMRPVLEIIRWQTCELLNIQLEKSKRISPADLLRFNWEVEQEKEKALTKEQIAAIFAKWDKKKANGV